MMCKNDSYWCWCLQVNCQTMMKKESRFQVRVVLWHDNFTGFKFNNVAHKQNKKKYLMFIVEIQKTHFAYNQNILVILMSKTRTEFS